MTALRTYSRPSIATHPGDSVGFIVPAYFHFYSIARLLDLNIVELSSYPSLEVREDDLVDLFSKAKVVVIANIDNPTGRTLDHRLARFLGDLACDKKVYVVHDIAYYTLLYETAMNWPENYCYDYVVAVSTFSKDLGIPGWRVGFVVAPSMVAEAVAHVREATSYNTPVPSQILVLEYLRDGYRQKFLPRVLGEYARRRLEEMASSIEAIGDVRGLGLMIGVELVKHDGSPDPELLQATLIRAFKKGLLVIGAGLSTIRIAPPLVITQEEMEVGLSILEEALREAISERAR